MGRTAAKIDANQPEIVEALRAVGVSVQSMAEIGGGCPDLLCGVDGPDGCVFIIEIKVPGEGLNPRQKSWHAAWRGPAHVAYSVEQALAITDRYRARGRVV
jgi:hypothetical protein